MTPARAVPRPAGRLAVAGGLALVVAAALYAFGRTHPPAYAMGLLGQHGLAVNRLKAQLATGMLGLALVQLTLALWMTNGSRGRDRAAAGAGAASRRRCELVSALVAGCRALHVRLRRAAGRPTVAVHSVAGCFFYGAFAAKVLIVRSRRLPGWALPLAGGLLVTLIAAMWCSSALWYFNNSRLLLP